MEIIDLGIKVFLAFIGLGALGALFQSGALSIILGFGGAAFIFYQYCEQKKIEEEKKERKRREALPRYLPKNIPDAIGEFARIASAAKARTGWEYRNDSVNIDVKYHEKTATLDLWCHGQCVGLMKPQNMPELVERSSDDDIRCILELPYDYQYNAQTLFENYKRGAPNAILDIKNEDDHSVLVHILFEKR